MDVDWSKAPDGATHYIIDNYPEKGLRLPPAFHIESDDRYKECGNESYWSKRNDDNLIIIPRPIEKWQPPRIEPDTTDAPSKYHVYIKGVWLDVYDILYAYSVNNRSACHQKDADAWQARTQGRYTGSS